MKKSAWLVPLAAVLAICLPAFALGDQTDSRLDQLFETLRSSQDQAVLEETESAIWKIWYHSGEQAVDEKMDRAAGLMLVGNLPAAERIYSEVIEMLPNFSEGWNRRATVRFYQNDLDGSLADIRETLRLEPRHFGAIWGLGMILGSQGDYERAILAFEQLLAIKPNSVDARPRIEMLKQEMKRGSV